MKLVKPQKKLIRLFRFQKNSRNFSGPKNLIKLFRPQKLDDPNRKQFHRWSFWWNNILVVITNIIMDGAVYTLTLTMMQSRKWIYCNFIKHFNSRCVWLQAPSDKVLRIYLHQKILSQSSLRGCLVSVWSHQIASQRKGKVT